MDAGEGVSPGKEELLFLNAGHSQNSWTDPCPSRSTGSPKLRATGELHVSCNQESTLSSCPLLREPSF